MLEGEMTAETDDRDTFRDALSDILALCANGEFKPCDVRAELLRAAYAVVTRAVDKYPIVALWEPQQ